MKYAVIQVSNGDFSIVSEWGVKDDAIVNFHSVCMNLWNAQDVNKACVILVNDNFSVQKIEYIKYDE